MGNPCSGVLSLQAVTKLLRSRSIEVAEVHKASAVGTVHQLKGFEYDHCAVHEELLCPETEEEKKITFVAFTRHRKSLVVLKRLPTSVHDVTLEGASYKTQRKVDQLLTTPAAHTRSGAEVTKKVRVAGHFDLGPLRGTISSVKGGKGATSLDKGR